MPFPESLGTDFYCADDVTDDLAFEDDPVRAFSQALYRRLSIKGLFYLREYGPGLFEMVLETGITNADIDAAIQRSLVLDDRVAQVTTQFVGEQILVFVKAHGDTNNTLTLTIDKASGALLPLEEN